MKKRKLLSRLAKTIGVFLVATTVAIGFLLSPLAKNLRSQLLSSVLSAALDRPVQIGGETQFELAKLLYVTATDVSLGRQRTPKGAIRQHHIQKIRVGLEPLPILFGNLEVGGVVLTGARILVESAPENSQGERPAWSFEELASLPSRLLKDPVSDELEVRDLRILIPDETNGWGTTINIREFFSRAVDNGTRLALRLDGTIGSNDVTASGSFPNPKSSEASPKGPFETTIMLPGLVLRHQGDIDFTGQFARMNATVSARTDSLGEFLELLRLQRVLEGKGEIRADISGLITAPVARNIALTVDFDDTSALRIAGHITNVFAFSGVELDFDVEMPAAADPNLRQPASIYDIRLSGFNGTFLGNPRDYYLEDLNIRTNAASGELSKIGPIWIDRITRDAEGLLGLNGIRVLSGPRDAPYFDLSGNLADTLRLKGIDLSGSVNLRFADILDKVPADQAHKLGRLKGEVVISDAKGSLRIDKLDAIVTETDLLSLRIWKEEGSPSDGTEARLNADLVISDFDAYSALFGKPAKNVGKLSYKGYLEFGDKSVGLSGISQLGQTVTETDILATSRNRQPFISGSVSSKLLHLTDVAKAAELRSMVNLPDDIELDLTKNYIDTLVADLDIRVDRIAGGGKAVSGLKTRFRYAENSVQLDPFQVSYLGGTIKAALGFRTDQENSPLSLKGRIEKLKMGTILKQLGLPQAVTGSLNLSFDLIARGSTAGKMVQSLSGSAAGSIWGGQISSRVIDLLGQSVVSWMFGKGGREHPAKLVCAVLPLRFKNGSGSARNLVVETDNVQIVGGGAFDMARDTIDIAFKPRPKRREAVNITTSFALRGKLSAPEVVILEGGGAGRVVGEVVTAPITLLGRLFANPEADRKHAAKHRPCVLPKASGPK